MGTIKVSVENQPPDTPFLTCKSGYDAVVIERNDGAHLEVDENVIRTPNRTRHWRGDGPIKVYRTGYDEVCVTKTDIPADVVIRNDEIVFCDPGYLETREEW